MINGTIESVAQDLNADTVALVRAEFLAAMISSLTSKQKQAVRSQVRKNIKMVRVHTPGWSKG